jgi:Ca2+/Na+ antiporter
MKKIKIAARTVWQIIVTFYQFTCIAARVVWKSKVEVSTLSILMLLCAIYYLLSVYSSPEKYEAGIVSAYNIGYKQGVKTVLDERTPSDTMLVYDKPNGNVIDTILIPGK